MIQDMNTYKKALIVALTVLWWPTVNAYADSMPANPSALKPEPWEKFSVSLGAFLSDTQSGVRVGSGIGLELDVEDVLGLEGQTTVLRAETHWRFTRSRRHRLDASWFALRRDAKRSVGADFDIKDRNGNTVTINAGTEVTSHFNLDIIEAAYSYSFLQDDRVDLAASFGAYVMPIDFGISATGLAQGDGQFKFTAPLPALGLRMDVALTPRWYLRTGSQFFYVEYENFTGQLLQMRAAVEFLPVQHFAVGLGVDTLRLGLENKNEDYPGVDLKGNVDFRYTGLQLYGKVRF